MIIKISVVKLFVVKRWRCVSVDQVSRDAELGLSFLPSVLPPFAPGQLPLFAQRGQCGLHGAWCRVVVLKHSTNFVDGDPSSRTGHEAKHAQLDRRAAESSQRRCHVLSGTVTASNPVVRQR